MQEKTTSKEDLFARIQRLVAKRDAERETGQRPGGSEHEAETAREPVDIAFAAERFHLHALVQGAASILQRRASAKGLATGVDMAANCPRLVVGDEARVRQALMALIDASLHSTSDGSIRLYVSVNDASSPATVRFDVTDTSAGLKPAEQIALFEGSTGTGSDGLELAGARRLAEAMGGGAGCDSALGQGTLYWLTFEAVLADGKAKDAEKDMVKDLEQGVVQELAKAAVEDAPNGAREDASNGAKQDTAMETTLREALTGHVLVVEDNTVNRLLIRAYLEEFGLSYDVAETGTTALMCLSARAYDLVLMDTGLPDYDGLEMADRIRSLLTPSSQVPIVALATKSDKDNGQALVEAGVNGCMAKPIQGRALYAAMVPFLPAQHQAGLAEAS